MEQLLEQFLQGISWPRETLVSFELSSGGDAIAIDVDMPEVEDMPTRITSVPERGYKLSVKQIKPKQINEIYSRLVHGVGFRIIGEVFATLPTVDKVTLSAFTQRDSPVTGERVDTYIYSVTVERAAWSRINFKKLSAVDFGKGINVRNVSTWGKQMQVDPGPEIAAQFSRTIRPFAHSWRAQGPHPAAQQPAQREQKIRATPMAWSKLA